MSLNALAHFEDLMNKIEQMFISRHLHEHPIRHRHPLARFIAPSSETAGFLRNYIPPHCALENQAIGTKISGGDENKFQVSVDVQHFAPDEISVKVVDSYVIVEGKHEEKCDEHGYVSRQFVRRFKLPQGCLPDTVESQLSSDGVLSITAPKVLPLPSMGEKIVPITYTR